jgi:hypothetical protein
MGLRYAGQEGALVLINSTTQEQKLPSMAIESTSFGFPFELTKKQFIGELGPDYREFADGYELEFKFEPTDADEVVDYVNAIKAKAEGRSTDEFAAQLRYASPDGSTLQITFRDLHWEGLPFEQASRTDFLTGTHRCKGKVYKIQVI